MPAKKNTYKVRYTYVSNIPELIERQMVRLEVALNEGAADGYRLHSTFTAESEDYSVVGAVMELRQ